MIRKIIALIFLVSMVGLVQANEICPASNEFDFSIIPCEAITPTMGECENFTATTVFIDNASINETIEMNLKIPAFDIYNFSFNFSNNGSYQIILCDGTTATVEVGFFEQGYGTSLFTFIFPPILLAFIFLFISAKMNHGYEEEEEENTFENLPENNFKTSRIIPTILMLFSFVPMIFVIRFVGLNLERYLPTSNVTAFYNTFYIFFSIMFWFIFLLSIIIFFSSWFKKRNIAKGITFQE